MRSIFIFGLLLAVLSLTAGCVKNSPVSELFAPGKDSVAAAQTATVADFSTSYKENSMKANSQYRGKWVKIRGTITSISKHDPFQGTGSTKYYFVGLQDDTGKTKDVITCRFNFNKESELMQLKSGQTALFYGMIEDMTSTNQGLPIISDCLIVK